MGNVTLTYNQLTLHGISRQGKELEAFCVEELNKTETPDWLRDIYRFILNWLSDEDYIVAHTSGSTGKPKPIKLQKKHMVASAKKTVEYFNLDYRKKALLCLSANYIAGKMMLVRAFVGGFNLILAEPSGNPLKEVSQTIDFAAMVPLQVFNSKGELGKVKEVIIGGGAVSDELKQQLLGLPTQFYETYGMTETVSHVAIRKIEKDNFCFKAMPNVEFRQDERACLVILAPDICHGKIITNDIVSLKSKCEFLFLGRYDNVINTGGVKIIPEEVERKLSKVIQVPFIISSLPDEKLGEKVVLVLKLGKETPGIDFSGLNKFETPKRIISIPEFPKTTTGKIQRNRIKELIEKAADEL